MQARKQNSNNAKYKLKLFEILQTQRKANEKKKKAQSSFSKLMAYPEKKERDAIKRYYR